MTDRAHDVDDKGPIATRLAKLFAVQERVWQLRDELAVAEAELEALRGADR